MNIKSDYTQQQSLGSLENAERMSLHNAKPPADIKGIKIERLLGQGAFGQVWLGRDLNTGRQVAVKFYLYRGGVNWSLLDREVKHMVNMSTGRHIVQVLGVGWDSEPPYYVMEYLENGSLEDMLRTRGVLSTSETVSLLRDLAEGLSFAHGKGVLHCDMKPANVVLDHDWRPRLADFGQSRMSDEQTPSLGTLFFMAPEQADLEASPDAAWDVYALGAIAYCMLVGSPPYRTPEMVETLDTADSLVDRLEKYRKTISRLPTPRLHHRRKNVDKGLCQIIDRCLAVSPNERFSNVQQVIEAIESRSRARSRRPLLLLGIIGPILFLVVMLLFSTRSIAVAKNESLQRTLDLSLRSNQMAAQFAAKTLEGEFLLLFRLIEQEANQPEVRRRVALLNTAGDKLLAACVDNTGQDAPPESKAAAVALKQLDEQTDLQTYVAERLEAIRASRFASGSAIFDSLFVNDPKGTNVAIQFANQSDAILKDPVGRNFAHRSYFLGTRRDRLGAPRSELTPTRHTHLSAVFRSSATGRWKVGISAPIWPKSREFEAAEAMDPIGVLVLTINLGDLSLLPADEKTKNARDRFATLVDGRVGKLQGTLLQHPFLDSDAIRDPNAIVPQIDERTLSQLRTGEGILEFLDPASKFEGGETYAGAWVTAMQPVHFNTERDSGKQNSAPDRNSDLWVLVQERRSQVAAPVVELGSRLQRESFIELGVVVLVTMILWYFVFSQSNSSSAAPLASPNSALTGLNTTTDINA